MMKGLLQQGNNNNEPSPRVARSSFVCVLVCGIFIFHLAQEYRIEKAFATTSSEPTRSRVLANATGGSSRSTVSSSSTAPPRSIVNGIDDEELLRALNSTEFLDFYKSFQNRQKQQHDNSISLSDTEESSVDATGEETLMDDNSDSEIEEPETESPILQPHNKRRLAVAQFIDDKAGLFGAYSLKTQMKRFGMTDAGVEQVTVIPTTYPEKFPDQYRLLQEWLGPDHIHQVNTSYIYSKMMDQLWRGTYNKLWLFNLTDYDRVIILDGDVLVRQSLMHWFDYPVPCATQPDVELHWNSGAMVIEPSTEIFNKMMDVIPHVRVYRQDEDTKDGMAPNIGDQDFISAFFTHEEYASGKHATSPWRMKTMPSNSAPLSSRFSNRIPGATYFCKFRLYIIETVHLTAHKPWRARTRPRDECLCRFMWEFHKSQDGLEKYSDEYGFDKLWGGYLQNCDPYREQFELEEREQNNSNNHTHAITDTDTGTDSS